MPWAVLLEAALQPCGWLALATGVPLRFPHDLFFRNLDGRATVRRTPDTSSGRLTSRVRLKSLSSSGGIALVAFDVRCNDRRGSVLELETSFGFFPDESLRTQAGLKLRDDETDHSRRAFAAGRDGEDARQDRADWMPEGRLATLDRFHTLDPLGGAQGLGFAIGVHDVNPSAWFFKAHFFQDPVQPGSLGIHMMIEALTALAIERERTSGRRFVAAPVSLAPAIPTVWKYRGQVRPENARVVVICDVTEVKQDQTAAANGEAAEVIYVGEGSLFVDGLKVYSASGLSLAGRVRREV
jgi:3-hydroxymyristoyl/3-hydroxydecanoyl-(acyl carrier protein) dehydratase